MVSIDFHVIYSARIRARPCLDDAPRVCTLFTAFKQKNPLGNPFRHSWFSSHYVFFRCKQTWLPCLKEWVGMGVKHAISRSRSCLIHFWRSKKHFWKTIFFETRETQGWHRGGTNTNSGNSGLATDVLISTVPITQCRGLFTVYTVKLAWLHTGPLKSPGTGGPADSSSSRIHVHK